MKTLQNSLFFLAVIATACGGNVIQPPVVNQHAAQPVATDDALQYQMAEIAREAGGRVGVAAMVLETGENLRLNANERFPMQSVVKLPIAMAVFKQIDEGKLTLDQNISVTKEDFVTSAQRSPIRDGNPKGAEIPVSELIRFAVSESDGTASDVLMRVAGGASAIQGYLDDLGIVEIEIKRSHKEFGKDWEMQYDNWASPEGSAALLDVLQNGEEMSVEHRELLLKFMSVTLTGPNRLKGLLPPGTPVAHKTGTGGTRNGITSATNDIGIITLPNGSHIAIAVFVADSPANQKTRESVIAKIAQVIFEKWSQPRLPSKTRGESVGNHIDFNLRHTLY